MAELGKQLNSMSTLGTMKRLAYLCYYRQLVLYNCFIPVSLKSARDFKHGSWLTFLDFDSLALNSRITVSDIKSLK